MHVIATAGHVDHGKSTLVRALTGINPDRLREEQEREMTIDLGFAWMTLPNGDDVGIIDVPGHIDFIENMLAGVGGIDAALIVIAADEGPMPQTREHLAILELLHVPRAVVALTKTDLAPDPDWVELVSADIGALLDGTRLAGAAIVPVSARRGEGLSELRRRMQDMLESVPARRDQHKPRLSVDRAFSIAGFGTVVTGTLVDGAFAVGDEVVILPRGSASRIRGLQTHKQKLERAQVGSRVAINLAGVAVEDIRRGDVIAKPGALEPTRRLDVRLDALEPRRLGSPAIRAIRHNALVKLFLGAGETVARLRLLQGDELPAGQSAWAQLELDEPVACAAGDRFILRLPSPSLTIGGGAVVDPAPARRHRRKAGRADDGVLLHLASLLEGTPRDRVLNALRQRGFVSRSELGRAIELPGLDEQLVELERDGLVAASQDVAALSSTWRTHLEKAAALLTAFHSAQPLVEGMPRDTLRSRLSLNPRDFNALVALGCGTSAPGGDGHALLADEAETIRLASHHVRLAPQQQAAVDVLLARMRAAEFATPSIKECRAEVGDAVFDVLVRRGELVPLNDDIVLLRQTYADAVAAIRERIRGEGPLTAAQVRDMFGTSRKYALALLEYLDRAGVTRRVGDARILR